MPIIDVTLAGTEARISSVERGSVLQVHPASRPTRTARHAHILSTSLTASFRSGRRFCTPPNSGERTLAQATSSCLLASERV